MCGSIAQLVHCDRRPLLSRPAPLLPAGGQRPRPESGMIKRAHGLSAMYPHGNGQPSLPTTGIGQRPGWQLASERSRKRHTSRIRGCGGTGEQAMCTSRSTGQTS
ncbi:hypothetical protein COCVIDRAFT_12144 [Bipolaris victoriae FI3]|uniref:Uncharacterized protein n=2 Tax=Bipolaris TaxID=33194 RepID=W6YAJ4_COCC2|nr:uncharacterized protein COCCADRAFT_23847 [Bipolaris zeicola 26-R-13]XP_014561261.1 hypothetical protein COCVIDRAFT_12144 [Bipolaris victoriae FI3]EUC36417.1 hypothetical protein COCCADRAFT_23847 [Bipolaris zeicola 26-R-13]